MVERHFSVSFGLLLCVVWISFQTAQAQETHRNIMSDITFQCIADEVSAFSKGQPLHLTGAGHSRIVAGELEARLLENGYSLVESPEARHLEYDVEHADVVLKREGRNKLLRTVSVGLTFKIFDSVVDNSDQNETISKKLIDSGTCSSKRLDTIDRSMVESLGYDGFPETNPIVPTKGGWRRFVKPAVLMGATAVGTYLFFNLRSKRADSG